MYHLETVADFEYSLKMKTAKTHAFVDVPTNCVDYVWLFARVPTYSKARQVLGDFIINLHYLKSTR